jgi:hypothetical protein
MPTPPCVVGATLARPRRQNHGAVEKPPTIKIGGLEGEPCAASFLARLRARATGLFSPIAPKDRGPSMTSPSYACCPRSAYGTPAARSSN